MILTQLSKAYVNALSLLALSDISAFFSKVFYVVIAILILLLMITIHELGHYAAGKKLGFKINEFAIGMGPKIFSRTDKNTGEVFSVRAFPLGGFCAFAGEDEAADDNACSFNSQPPWKRLIVLFSGAFLNFVSAILIVVIAFSMFGEFMPQITEIQPNSPNYQTETIKEGDIIVKINGKNIFLVPDIGELIANADTTLSMTVYRPANPDALPKVLKEGNNGIFITFDNIKKDTIKTVEDGKEIEYVGLGITRNYTQTRIKHPFFVALTRGIPYCLRVGTVVLKTLGQLLTGAIGLDAVGGPISTIDIASQVVATGFANILYLITLISVNLAVFNLLPVPSLDGCRMIFVVIEWIRGKPVNKTIEGYVHLIGIIVLLAFVVLIDVLKLFSL